MAGLVIAPAVGALIFGYVEPLFGGLSNFTQRVLQSFFVYAIFGAYPSTAILGLPTLLALQDRVRPTALHCALVGAAIASLPWLLLGLLVSPDQASIGGRATHGDGHITAYGLWELAHFVGPIALVGAISRIAFWMIAVWRIRRT